MRVVARTVAGCSRNAALSAGAACLAAAALFACLAAAVATGSPALQRFDAGVAAWMHVAATPALTALMRSLTWLGAPAVLLALAAVVALVALQRRRHRDAVFVALAVGGGEALNGVLKLLFERARPAGGSAFAILHSYSFPSGHALGATAACGALTLIAVRGMPAGAHRTLSVTALGLAAAVICTSRVYLGAHYASDVIGGVLEGVLWLGISFLLVGRRRPEGTGGSRR